MDTLTINGLNFYDYLFLLKNYNILILYDYRYYCDLKLSLNSIDNRGVRIRYKCPNTDTLCYNTDSVRRTLYIPLDKLYIIGESIRQIKITLFIINFMNNVF